MKILSACPREFVNIAADDRQPAEDLISAGIAANAFDAVNSKRENTSLLRPKQNCDKTSAVGAAQFSPALQRWVGIRMDWSTVGTTGISCAVPTGLGITHHRYPALKRWAKIFRPASGTVSFAVLASSLTKSLTGQSAYFGSFGIRESGRKPASIGPAMRPA